MDYLIRESVKDDSHGIMHVVTLAWNETYKGIVPDSDLQELYLNEEENAKKSYESFDINDNNKLVLEVDGEVVDSSMYTRREGSLILTLKPDYLSTLELGEHDIAFTFSQTTELKTTFNVVKDEPTEEPDVTPDEEETEEKTPITNDNIMLYIYLLSISTITLIGSLIIKKYN